jgi:hypothetical protein
MTESGFCDPRCRYCSVEIMYVGTLWLKHKVADVNGFCPNSPDDLHHPVAETETQRPGSEARPACPDRPRRPATPVNGAAPHAPRGAGSPPPPVPSPSPTGAGAW